MDAEDGWCLRPAGAWPINVKGERHYDTHQGDSEYRCRDTDRFVRAVGAGRICREPHATRGEVVATGSGAIDVTGLTLVHGFVESQLNPSDGSVSIGGSGLAELDICISNVATGTFITGPASFGSGGHADAATSGGDPVGIFGLVPELFLPAGYVSDSLLSDTATFSADTVESLGVTLGRYEWEWGSGANQNFTLLALPPLPEPSTWAMMLLGFAGLGLMGYRSARRLRAACNA